MGSSFLVSKGYRISHGMILSLLDKYPDLMDQMYSLPQLNNPYSVRQFMKAGEWPRDFTFGDEQWKQLNKKLE